MSESRSVVASAREFMRRLKAAFSMVPTYSSSGYVPRIHEPYAGAWQKNVSCETDRNILAFSAVYACVALRAGDISKLRVKLIRQDSDFIWSEVRGESPFWPVLRKPNRYQTRIQFYNQWITSKLLHGNTYVYKQRDQRPIVSDLYILNPTTVMPLIATDGSVWYRINATSLAGVPEQVTVPADDIIHDRGPTLWHPLVGVSPIYAAAASATQGIRIQAQSARFFENQARPSMHLDRPEFIPDQELQKVKERIDQFNSGMNVGKTLVTSGGWKATPITIAAEDAQLIEQLNWTVRDVAAAFRTPLHKIQAGPPPTFNNISAFNQDYYTQTLQEDIEAIELLLEEGLGLPRDMGVEFDLDGLLRLDPLTRSQMYESGIKAGWLKRNEARFSENRAPAPGGDVLLVQQQDVPLEMAAQIAQAALDAKMNSPAPPTSEPANDEPMPDDEAAKRLADEFITKIKMADLIDG